MNYRGNDDKPLPLRAKEIDEWIRARALELAKAQGKAVATDLEWMAAVRIYDLLARSGRGYGQRVDQSYPTVKR